jgi:hypothetical protein
LFTTLENVVEWAINLASQNPRRFGRRRRASTPVPTQAPPVLATPVRRSTQEQVRSPRRGNRHASSSSGSPRTLVLPINQAYQDEPVFPTIQRPIPVHPRREEPRISSGSGDDIVFNPVRIQNRPATPRIEAQEINAFYPEQIYISSVIPTRSPVELREFRNHCTQLLHTQNDPTVLIKHNLREILQITTSALHFQNLLWRGAIEISGNNITEQYSRIRRHTLQGRPDRANLEPAFQVVYYYGREEWTVYQL